MSYYKVIEKSSTWICPKTASYQITCVAGGDSSHYSSSSGGSYPRVHGSPTSFGSLLTASGTIAGYSEVTYTGNNEGIPFMGYSISCNNYGGYMTGNGYQDCSYGSGGSGRTQVHAGLAGKLLIGVFDIEEGTVIPCTIGEGGKTITTGRPINSAHNGADGVIVIMEV